MPQPEAPAARSGAIQGAAYSESASNGASMPTPARSQFPKLAFFISLLGRTPPSSTSLAQQLAERFLGKEYINESLSVVAELAFSEASIPKAQEFIRSLLFDIQPAAHHLLIPTFRWAGIATTNYDLVIERAYANCRERIQDPVPVLSNGDAIEHKTKRS